MNLGPKIENLGSGSDISVMKEKMYKCTKYVEDRGGLVHGCTWAGNMLRNSRI